MTTDMHQIGKYEILEELGRGGFATVYKAVDTTLDREIALKVLNPLILRDQAFINRFRQEARVMARLLHANIATVFEIGEVDGRHFIAMQYIQGRNLRDLMQERRLLPFDVVVSILEQIGLALDYAHAHGVIHRDVKPSNILVDEHGHATLTDFGIAKALEGTSIQTTSGTVMGTPYYASPEQAESRPLDGRSDLYSLGIVAYELCTGNVPFRADSTPSLYYKIVHETPRLPSEANPRAAEPIEQVLLKAIAKQPGQRYQSGQELVVALRAALKQLDELTRSLYDTAVELANERDLDGAESKLKILMAIDPSRDDARALAERIGRLRSSNQRYQELVAAVEQARAQAAALRRDDPDIVDREGVLRALAEQGDAPQPRPAPAGGPRSSTASSTSLRRLLRNIAIPLLVAGTLTLALGAYIPSRDPSIFIADSELEKLYHWLYGNMAIGLGAGIALCGLALLILALRRSD